MGVSQSEFDKIDSSSLLWSVSRRIISRICAQAYDRLGIFLTPLKIGLKTLTSRAAEIMTNTELDLPIASKDAEFARQVTNYWRNLPRVKEIKPFPRAVIPEGYKLVGLIVVRDGGVPGYGALVYFVSENEEGKRIIRLMAGRCKIGKRSIPAHEMESAAVGAEMTKEVVYAIMGRPEMRGIKLTIIMSGDSLCTACSFNPEIEIRNVLLRGCVNRTVQRCKEIVESVHGADIKLTWIPGNVNSADSVTKLHQEVVTMINSDLYRHGPPAAWEIDGKNQVQFLNINQEGVTFT